MRISGFFMSYPNKKRNSSNLYHPAFTIVELLVVIVVIGILATIVIVSYTGISNKATIASLQSDLSNASKQLKIDQVLNSAYPDTLASANGGKGIPASSGTTYRYTVNNNINPQFFCITATKNSKDYMISNDGAPAPGDCINYGLALHLDVGDDISYPSPFNSTIWTDLSGLGNNVTLNGGVTYNSSNGGALIFDGVNDYSITNNNFIINPKSLTISSWFKRLTNTANYGCVLHKSTDTSIGASEYWLGNDNTGKLTATIGARTGAGWAAGQTSTDATLGVWWNLAATWNGSVVKVYINGQFNKQYNLSSYSNIAVPTRIGASSDGASYQFSGAISDVMVYNRSLSSDEILQNFNMLKDRYGL